MMLVAARRVAVVSCALICFLSVGLTEAAPRSGTIDELAESILHDWKRFAFRSTRFVIRHGPERIPVTLDIFRAREDAIDERSNRCTADSIRRSITCDLALIDYLLDTFRIEHSTKSRKSLLKWIVAHEIGHIALNHSLSDYSDPLEGYLVFVPEQQRLELAADAFAIDLVGDLNHGAVEDYGLLLDIVNELIRKNLCPESFPRSCERIAPGVGIYFNSADNLPIKISAGGSHPEFVARFLRLLYLAGLNTNHRSINYLAGKVIEKLLVEVPGKGWVSLGEAFSGH